MVDINLLKDTKDEEQAKRRADAKLKFDLSSPGRERLDDREGKPPSKFSVWLRGLFGAKGPKPELPFRPERPAKPKAPRGKIEPPSVVTGPTDIFAEIDRPAAAAPTPKPPSLPAKNGNGKRAASPPPTAATANAGSFLVNLLPEELSISPVEVRQRLLSLALVGVFSLVGVGAIYLLLFFYQSNYVNRTASVQEEIAQVQADISRLRPTQVQAIEFAKRVELLAATLDHHIYWSNFFDKLEQYTVANVAFSSVFKGAIGTTMTFDGRAATIEDVAHQLAVFQQSASDFVTSAKLESLARAQAQTQGGQNLVVEGYTFSIAVSLVDGLFIKGEAADDASTAPAPDTTSTTPTQTNP